MSAPTSQNLPTFDPSSVDGFDGADDLRQAWRDGLTPDPTLTVSEWADRHRVLSPRASAEPGRYRTDRTPYMRAIMDALSPAHPARRVVFMKAAQVGATEAGNNWIGYVIHHAPGPMLAVQPTVELAKRFSRQRIEPLIEECPSLRERVRPARSRDAGNTVLSKEFPAGLLVLTGANSAVGLRSMPARYLFLDEVDAYPPSADEEGDPVALAEARTRTFSWRAKAFLTSTPTIHGFSRIEREYEASDQRRFFVPCPHCGVLQWLRFERLRWDKGKPETAHYECEACDAAIEEHHKTAMLQAGDWQATAEASDPGTIGFHLSALYSPVGWFSWADIARMWEAAQSTDEAKRSFKNGVLGETWVETGEAPDWQRLYDRREAWQIGTVPTDALFLTAGADVQKDRIEVSVWAWGRGLESWLVDHLVIEGGPERAESWDQLSELLDRTWPHAHGARLGLAKLAIDTGYETPAVYAWARRAGHAQVVPVKGVEGLQPRGSGDRADLRRCDRRRAQAAPRRPAVDDRGRDLQERDLSLPASRTTDRRGDWRKERCSRRGSSICRAASRPNGSSSSSAEQLVTVRTKRGFTRLDWQKLRERNEALDCRVYARAAAWIVGADRWTEAKWRDLEDQVGPAPEESGRARRRR